MSESLAVYQAIASITAALSKTGIAKHAPKPGSGVNYNFRGIDDVYNSLAPLLAEHKLCILPFALDRVCEERQSSKGGALFYVTVKVRFDFVASDGSKHEIMTYGEAMDVSDKATNKAMSAAYKYATMMAFCIPTVGEDSENDTHEVKAAAPRKASSLLHHPSALEPPHDSATGEIKPVAIPFDDTWVAWGGRYIAGIKTARSPDELDEWERLNGPSLDVMANKSPKAFASVSGAMVAARTKLNLAIDAEFADQTNVLT